MRPLVLVWVLALSALALGGCLSEGTPRGATGETTLPMPRPAPHPDPLALGAFPVTTFPYDAGEVTVGGPDANHSAYSYPSRIRGQLWVPEGPGPFPLAVFLHGQHSTCGVLGRESFIASADCEGYPGYEAYPNHLGYAYLAEHLASHGVATASILNKEINDRNGPEDVGMWARGELVLATIDALLDGTVAEVAGRLDPGRIGIMGHSRGGEGVVTAVHVNLLRETPIELAGVVALAPTDFNARGVPDVPLLSLVPYCDGDVSTLHGLRTYDHSRFADRADRDPASDLRVAKFQLVSMGSNHNFYNSAWAREPLPHVYDGDDGRFQLGSECQLPDDHGGGRLGAEDVKDQAIVQINGFFRWVLLDDAAHLPYLDGSAALPAEACPNDSAPCVDAVHATAFLPDRAILWNTTGLAFEAGAAASALPELEGFRTADHCAGSECGDRFYSEAGAVALRWDSAAILRVPLADDALRDMDVLAFRLAVPTDGAEYAPEQSVPLTVTLRDREGGTHTTTAAAHAGVLHQVGGRDVHTAGLYFGTVKDALHMVRIPLTAFDVPLDQVVSVELRFEGPYHERVLLAEGWTQAEDADPTTA